MSNAPSTSHSNHARESPSEEIPTGLQALFGARSTDRKTLPPWLPISLLALTTAALVAPVILFRRYRASPFGRELASAPPPPRRLNAQATGTPAVPAAPSTPSFPPTSASSSTRSTSPPTDDFNGAVYCAKAFGVATLLVGTGAGAVILGVRTTLGVNTTQEFAERMRTIMVTKMPVLSSRIHRSPEVTDGPASVHSSTTPSAGSQPRVEAHGNTLQWSWPDAQQRLADAWDKGGFSGWADAAMRELEAEAHAERARRGHA
ncbi:hypothetical protein OBBRIDRAFT_783457 [Obba rivulosa]|uniref:Transmembrane protein n=1 Tax=Obba rivulosa TaxID=1052685 RepID=A0A8E2DGT3_9APHY|nr:hypothetical protein OBBRIDRAFT_783457 [Obba rivulosa]